MGFFKKKHGAIDQLNTASPEEFATRLKYLEDLIAEYNKRLDEIVSDRVILGEEEYTLQVQYLEQKRDWLIIEKSRLTQVLMKRGGEALNLAENSPE